MKSRKNALVLAGMSLATALMVSGCGGPDNESTMATATDGKGQKAGSAGGASSADEYNAAASKAQSSNPYQTKGYPKPK